MILSEIASHFLRTVDAGVVVAHARKVAQFDRYQASIGIENAASVVAEAAQTLGLRDVTIQRFAATGGRQWWSFRAPVSWTPVTARLDVRTADGRSLLIDHATQPMSLATYSAPTPPSGISLPLVDGPDASGAIAIISGDESRGMDVVTHLTRCGARGFVTAAPSDLTAEGCDYPRRIELDPTTTLFAFSVTAKQLAEAKAMARAGAQAHVTIHIDRSASMPVVSGTLPGDSTNGEVWLTAHLCHPRPGANDNASGVAALLGVAAAHQRSRSASGSWPSQRTLRFLWGPEYLGTVAYLHDTLTGVRSGSAPRAVINCDMVGEDQSQCKSPFVVERNPDFNPSLIAPIAEEIVREVFEMTTDASSTWQTSPFMGFSDHALFADIAPAVQFCHPADRYNHSAADTSDRLSQIELLRATSTAAALAHVLANDALLEAREIGQVVKKWCAIESASARRIAEEHRDSAENHWGQRLVEYVERRSATLSALVLEPQQGIKTSQLPRDRRAGGVQRCWSGPFNLREMIADACPASRADATDLIRADKRNLALLLSFALLADGSRTRAAIIDETSLAHQRLLDESVAQRLFEVLRTSRWISET